jgi:hypothetical protein
VVVPYVVVREVSVALEVESVVDIVALSS